MFYRDTNKHFKPPSPPPPWPSSPTPPGSCSPKPPWSPSSSSPWPPSHAHLRSPSPPPLGPYSVTQFSTPFLMFHIASDPIDLKYDFYSLCHSLTMIQKITPGRCLFQHHGHAHDTHQFQSHLPIFHGVIVEQRCCHRFFQPLDPTTQIKVH